MNPAELGAIVWDAWRAERGGPAAIAHRQATRLAALVRFAREHSPLELYRGLPAGEVRLEQLPSVTVRCPRKSRRARATHREWPSMVAAGRSDTTTCTTPSQGGVPAHSQNSMR